MRVMEARTIGDVLRARADEMPEKLAFAERGESLSYGQLLEAATALAEGCRALGLTAGDRVAIALPAGLEFVRTFWGLQLAGVVTCALNPASPPASIVRRAQRVWPSLLVTNDPLLRSEAEASSLRTVSLETVPCVPRSEMDSTGRDASDIAILQTTSGTSGEPRAAMIRHSNVTASLASAVEAMGLGPQDVMVSWVPPWHDLGLIRFIVGGVFFGATCHLVQPAVSTIPEWLQTISRVRATLTGAPDFAYRLASRLVDPRTVDLSSLRIATNGGEPVRKTTVETFAERFGTTAITPGYGLAEATLGVTTMRPQSALRTDARGNVSCGLPLPGIEVRIDGERGEPGEIVVEGPVVFAGYFDADEATQQTLRDGTLRTGDIGVIDDDGHLYVLGRKRAMLKRGGAVLAPRELEEAAQTVQDVRIAAAVGLTSAFASEEIVVAIEIANDEERDRVVAEVSAAIHAALGFVPDRVVVLPRNAIPRTYNGKLRHDALRAALMEGQL
jgi:acyl-CoA synthetase (AMP-forming)/AMP-acid ligase II